MNNELLKEYIINSLKEILEEKKKTTVKNLPKAYKKGGTKASNKSMAREINKCADPKNRPKSCYDYWDADKKYDKSKKKKLKESDLSENNHIVIYPNFQGADVPDDYINNKKINILSTNKLIGNEPDKDKDYFISQKKDYIQKIIRDVKKTGIETIPPVIAIKHPLVNGYYLVIDGNHRLGAFKIGNIPQIPVVIASREEIYLAEPGIEDWHEGLEPDIIALDEAIQSNYDLNIYFNTEDIK